jgi:hypothetical protein
MDTLSELSDEQVAELESSIVTEFESVEQGDPTPESVDAMTTLADMLESVRGESQKRIAQAEELTVRAEEAAARVYESNMEEETEVVPEEETPMEETDDMKKKEVAPVKEAPTTPTEASTDVEEVTEFVTDETVTDSADVVEAEVTEVAEEFAADATEATVETEVTEEFTAEETAVETTTETTEIEPEAQEEAPVTAAAEGAFEAPADRRPVAPATAVPVAITAGADIPGYTAGSTIDSMNDVAVAMEKRLHSLRRVNGGDGEQHIVASLTTQYPAARQLGTDLEENRAKIESVVGPEALVASGGYATPLEVRYDVFGLGSAARPVRDSLPSFQADRGGIRYVTPPVLSSYANAVGVWTNTTDTTPEANTKTSLTVSAAAEQTAYTDAVTLQMQFGNLFSRAYPELLARHNELGLIQHAREAEQNILTRIGDASTAVTTTSLIGFGRDFLVQIKRASAAYRSRHRIDPTTQLRAIIPAWVIDAVSADLTLAMPGDGTLSVGAAEINGYLASSNVSLVASLDQNVFGAQTTGALVEFADSFTWYLFAEGSFIFLDGGTLDLGIIRDSGLVGTNDYKMFVETFEGVAFVGTESLKITSTISVNGVAAALRDTTGGATAAAIEY